MNEPRKGEAFGDLGLDPVLVQTVAELGYEEPTPIQQAAIPVQLTGVDVLGQAATGTGKTAAFALPVLDRLGAEPANVVAALILVPTRELAMQVRDAVAAYGRGRRVRVVAVFGGQPIHRQLAALRDGAHVVVATPGRARDLVDRRALDLGSVQMVVLDEADEMLDMGFAEDLEFLLDRTPTERQTVLFSATLPPRIAAIARRHLREPVRIAVDHEEHGPDAGLVRQTAYVVDRFHKVAALDRVLDIEDAGAALVFCRTRAEVDELTVAMNNRNHRAEALHGGMDQSQRDRVMGRLRDGTAELLVATDVAARGIDIDTLTHVVNYDVPSAPETYVHRIGRVGRAGRTGTAITFVEPRQRRLLQNIERLTGQRIDIARIPSVDDLRASRVERMAAALEEVASVEDLEDHAEVLDQLADMDPRTAALAAIALLRAHEGEIDEAEIPHASFKGNRADDAGRDRPRRNDRPGPGGRDRQDDRRGRTPGVASIYVNVGRRAGVRPADLVGAIANEANLSGRDIGPIRISDTYSVIGVPEEALERAIAGLNRGSVRGRPVKARRFTE